MIQYFNKDGRDRCTPCRLVKVIQSKKMFKIKNAKIITTITNQKKKNIQTQKQWARVSKVTHEPLTILESASELHFKISASRIF